MATMKYCPIKKADDELQLAFAEVYAPMIPDTDGDFMVAEEIRKMAHNFLKSNNLGNVDRNHDNSDYDAHVVESFVARKGDPDFLEGSWVVGVHIADPDLWQQIKDGELNGFSMQAKAMKSDAILEVEIPAVIRGTTSTYRKDASASDSGHFHMFDVIFDEATGQLIGGKTNLADGHFHLIKQGTVTEPAGSDGHTHRFSAVDGIGEMELSAEDIANGSLAA